MSILDDEVCQLESIIKIEKEVFEDVPELKDCRVKVYDVLKPHVVLNRLSDTTLNYFLKTKVQVHPKNDFNEFLRKKPKSIRRFFFKGPYFCDHCEKVCPSRYAIASHLKFRHFKPGPFHCDLCPTSLREKYMLNNHMRSCHLKIKPHACEKCDFKTALAGSLKRHVIVMHGEKKICKICEKPVSDLDAHLKTVHSEPTVGCNFCCRRFKSSNLEKHMLLVHGSTNMEKDFITKRQRFSCSVCLQEYNYVNGLKRHWEEKHLITHGAFEAPRRERPKRLVLPKVLSAKKFICDFCGVSKKVRTRFQTHLTDNHVIRNPPLACKQCNDTFTMRVALLDHRKKFHPRPQSNKIFTCDTCGFETKKKEYLSRHVQTHWKNLTKCPICHRFVKQMARHLQGHKPKTCEICKKSFSSRALTPHMRQHKNEKKCKICDKRFIPVELKKHMIAAHTKGKIFECRCGSIFKNIEGLRRHRKSHDEKNIPCKDCDAKFSMKTALMQHMKVHHPESYANRENKRGSKSSKKLKNK